MSTVTLKNVSKNYAGVPVSQNIDLQIDNGEFVVFVGPSGCGKSTLLRMIAGLEEISSGELYIGDVCVNDKPPSERSVGMVFQSYALYPHLTVAENMAFGLKLAKTERAEIERRIESAARILQLDKLLERKPKDLSGGQRQRVAIGRTMVREPKVLLFDEPLSNLDAGLRVQMRIEIASLHRRLRSTMIYVTHDQVEAMTLADKIVVLDGGRIAQVGAPLELYHYPGNRFVAGFIGSPQMNFIDVSLHRPGERLTEIRLPGGQLLAIPVDSRGIEAGAAMTLGIRPEHCLDPEQAEARLPGTPRAVERLGDQTLVYLELEGVGPATLRLEGDVPIDERKPMALGLDPNRCHLFSSDGNACPRHYREAGFAD
ncbi:maltose/maltodextrin import ATP-binding protein MalK [Marinobacterium nitratireducens]|uniref:Maltose/maltodextrin import ATP-binding protein MalK n=1 Tax=Marinobacterium nitratireducens TaxID=518897 RepID=A0A917ZNL4_9GAMM|nr:maltose/maltodextrin ABC transporter ATP-binding protein MalK [Marinobacterium nitratireducens]GGO87379.1 maltose/maltodextrin import ATP-binding protein MalK [Marinobacterium nitratireducens]